MLEVFACLDEKHKWFGIFKKISKRFDKIQKKNDFPIFGIVVAKIAQYFPFRGRGVRVFSPFRSLSEGL